MYTATINKKPDPSVHIFTGTEISDIKWDTHYTSECSCGWYKAWVDSPPEYKGKDGFSSYNGAWSYWNSLHYKSLL